MGTLCHWNDARRAGLSASTLSTGCSQMLQGTRCCEAVGTVTVSAQPSAFTRIDEAPGEPGDADGPPEPGPSTLEPHGLPFQEGVGETDFGVTVHK